MEFSDRFVRQSNICMSISVLSSERTQHFRVLYVGASPKGVHPVTFRTWQLSLLGAMVVFGRE